MRHGVDRGDASVSEHSAAIRELDDFLETM